MDDQTRIGIGAGAIFAIVGVLSPFIGWWAVPIMALFAVAALWGFWPLVSTGGMNGWQFWRVYIPLPQVTSRLYGLTRGTAIAEFAEGSSKDAKDPSGDILNWYAYWLIQHDVPVYGVRPPSKMREKIKQCDADGKYYFADGATRMTGGYPPRSVYEELVVCRSDLRQQWKRLITAPDERMH